jgi:hypothetical protein
LIGLQLGAQEKAVIVGLSFPALSSGMKLLTDLGISRELTGRTRNRVFVYDAYLKILNVGTEPF